VNHRLPQPNPIKHIGQMDDVWKQKNTSSRNEYTALS